MLQTEMGSHMVYGVRNVKQTLSRTIYRLIQSVSDEHIAHIQYRFILAKN